MNENTKTDTRESRRFYVAVDGEVKHAMGYSCAPTNDGYWWFPSVGYSLQYGASAFDTPEEAAKKARKECRDNIEVWTKRLEETK